MVLGAGDSDPVGLHAGNFVSMHAYLRELQADSWSPQVKMAPKGSISISDLWGHTVGGRKHEYNMAGWASPEEEHTMAPFSEGVLQSYLLHTAT